VSVSRIAAMNSQPRVARRSGCAGVSKIAGDIVQQPIAAYSHSMPTDGCNRLFDCAPTRVY
jgi:hypothetical protein